MSCEDLSGDTYIRIHNEYFENIVVEVGELIFGEIAKGTITGEMKVTTGKHAISINTISGLNIVQDIVITPKESRIVIVLTRSGQVILEG